MTVQAQYLAYILEQLGGVADLRTRRMFGAVGLYSGEFFFAVIDDDTLYFKSDSSNSADYIARRMPRFMPNPDKPDVALGYFQVPADVIEDAQELAAWARKAIAVALGSHAKKARPRTGARLEKKVRPKKKARPKQSARAKPKARPKRKAPKRR